MNSAIRSLAVLFATIPWFAACRSASDSTSGSHAAASSTARAIVEDFRPIESCSCDGFELAFRIIREEHEPGADPERGRFLVPEFRLRRESKEWVFQPAADCPLPQRLYANHVQLGIACSDIRYVMAGPHWSGGYAVGRQSWSRRIDGDPSLANYLMRPMLSASGLGAPNWGEAERPEPEKVRISCQRLTTDQSWAQIFDWGARAQWVELRLGRAR